MEEEFSNNQLENNENSKNIENCLKKIENLEDNHKKLKYSNFLQFDNNIQKPQNEKDLEINLTLDDSYMEKKLSQLIDFYENLVKNQENYYEDCLDSIEVIEKEEKELKQKIFHLEKRIIEEEENLRKDKNQETKNYLKLVDKIDKLKLISLKKNLIYKDEKYQLDILDKKIIQEDKEFIRITSELKKDGEKLEKINKNYESKKKGLSKLQKNLISQKEKNNNYDLEIKKINERTRWLNNEIQNLKGNIRVYLRIKPLSKNERSTITILENTRLELQIPKKLIRSENYKKNYLYNFEHIFDHKATQEEIFEELNDLMLSVYDGFNVCIFAYGPTGTGKTFTMMGDTTHQFRGLAPRVLEKIFELIEKGKSENNINSLAQMELLEIYQDEVRSLLPNSKIRKDIFSVLEAFNFLENAINKRVVKKTNCNAESSRSHLIFKLIVTTKNLFTDKTRVGTLVLVDLAGSERVDFSKTTGQSFKETLAINKSLTSLGDVISALYKKVFLKGKTCAV